MKAMAVEPKKPGSARCEDIPEPDVHEGSVLVEAVAVGVCGTEVEIVEDSKACVRRRCMPASARQRIPRADRRRLPRLELDRRVGFSPQAAEESWMGCCIGSLALAMRRARWLRGPIPPL